MNPILKVSPGSFCSLKVMNVFKFSFDDLLCRPEPPPNGRYKFTIIEPEHVESLPECTLPSPPAGSENESADEPNTNESGGIGIVDIDLSVHVNCNPITFPDLEKDLCVFDSRRVTGLMLLTAMEWSDWAPPENSARVYMWTEMNQESPEIEDSASSATLTLPSCNLAALVSSITGPSTLVKLNFFVTGRVVEKEDGIEASILSPKLAIGSTSVHVSINAHPQEGSCTFLHLPTSIYARSTALRVQCLDWVDPVSSNLVNQTAGPSFPISINLHRSNDLSCNRNSSSSSAESASVPGLRIISDTEVEGEFPSACWTVFAVVSSELSGLSTSVKIADALEVTLPSNSDSFNILNNETTISDISNSVNVANQIINDASHEDKMVAGGEEVSVELAVQAIREKLARGEHTLGVFENQEVMKFAQGALEYYVAHRDSSSLEDDADSLFLTEISLLLEQIVLDRDHQISKMTPRRGTLDINTDSSVENLKTIWKAMDLWVGDAVDTQASCDRYDSAMSLFRRSIPTFWNGALFLSAMAGT